MEFADMHPVQRLMMRIFKPYAYWYHRSALLPVHGYHVTRTKDHGPGIRYLAYYKGVRFPFHGENAEALKMATVFCERMNSYIDIK